MPLLSYLRTFLASWRDYPLEPGTALNQRYTVQRLLGEGSYGLTYLAVDNLRGSQVAIKQARPSKGALARQLLARESAVLQALDHPGLPSFQGEVINGADRFLLMSYLHGDTLEQLIFEQGRRYDELRCARITLQLLELVDYIHYRGYVHLDLRIPNVLFHDERLLLIDFGLARRIGEPPDAELDPRSLWDRWFSKVRSKPFKEAEAASDLEDIGHFMLYMLYSTYEPDAAVEGLTTEQAQEPSWQEELQLSPELRLMIERLFRLQPPYPDAAGFIKELREFVSTRETL